MDKLGFVLVKHKNGLLKWNGCIDPKNRKKKKFSLNVAHGEKYTTYMGSSIKVSNGKTYLEVDLMEQNCICKAWRMSRIPCDHACVTI